MEKVFVQQDFFPVVLQLGVALAFVVIVMFVSHTVAGKRRKIHTTRKEDNFECGIEIKGNARFPFSVKYFLIAILFVLFDVEVIFFYPWALNFKSFVADRLPMFAEMMLFVGIFLVGFYYILKKGALDWNTPPKNSDKGI